MYAKKSLWNLAALFIILAMVMSACATPAAPTAAPVEPAEETEPPAEATEPPAAGGDQAAGFAGGQGDDAVGALDLVECVADGLEEVARVGVADQVGEHLGIGFG